MESAGTKQGNVETRLAKIQQVAPLSTARPFELHFQDGERRRVATRLILKGVLPLGYTPSPTHCYTVEHQEDIQGLLDYSTEASARKVLSTLMPGHWHIGYAHALMAAAVGINMAGPEDAPVQVSWLVKAVDFSHISSTTVVWQDKNALLSSTLQSHAQHLAIAHLTNSDAHWHLHPSPYQSAQEARELDTIISAPSRHVTDIILALSCMFARLAVFILVPITYISHAPAARYQYLGLLRSTNRMSIIMAQPVAPGAVQHVWLCVFKDKALHRAMCRQETYG
jgi:hypothetical protein